MLTTDTGRISLEYMMLEYIRNKYDAFMSKKKKRRNHHNNRKVKVVEKIVQVFKPTDNQHDPASDAIIFRSELNYIANCILDYPNIETGGQLFGYWTSEGVPVVLYAIGPGRNANHQTSFFIQDLDYLARIGDVLVHEYGLQHMGEWHSHHQLGLARPSGHDANNIYSNMLKAKRSKFLLCIGICTNTAATLNAFNFHESTPQYKESQWTIIEKESPFRERIDIRLQRNLLHPHTIHATLADMNIKPTTTTTIAQPTKPTYTNGYWLDEKANNLVLKQIIDFLKVQHPYQEVKPAIDANKLVHIQIISSIKQETEIEIIFPQQFPIVAPIITQIYRSLNIQADWTFDTDIFSSFIKYYKQIIF